MGKEKWHKKKDVQSISKILQDGLNELFSSKAYTDFLRMISRFPNYSYANTVLVLRQCPHATETHTFRGWIKRGRVPNQSGIRIRAPRNESSKKKEDIPTGSEDEPDDDMDFRTMTVFDISQTSPLNGREEDNTQAAPVKIVANPFRAELLEGDVEGFEELMAVLRQISPYAIRILPLPEKDPRRGFTAFSRRFICVRQGMSQLHTLKTTIHEIAHALHHGLVPDKNLREIEAESIAFIVSARLGFDTSSYSFQYIAGYSVGKSKKEMQAVLDSIQKAACYLIDSIEGELEARRIHYDEEDYVMLVNDNTAMRLHTNGVPVYLYYPGKGELLATKKTQILEHSGPYVVETELWRDRDRVAA